MSRIRRSVSMRSGAATAAVGAAAALSCATAGSAAQAIAATAAATKNLRACAMPGPPAAMNGVIGYSSSDFASSTSSRSMASAGASAAACS